MQIEEYISFVKAIGQKPVKTENCYWQRIHPVGYITAPEGFPVRVESTDIQQMLWKKGALLLRVIEPEHKIQTKHELWHRYECTEPYDLGSLGQKARNQTRRGLENCEIRQISPEQLAEEGLPATVDTYKRHGDHIDKMSSDDILAWKRSLEVYSQYPDIRVYGAFVKDLEYRLSAYLIVILVGECWYISIHRSTSESLPFYPNNALVFSVTQDLLVHTESSIVSYGIESIEKNPNLKRFKVNMGYQLQPVRQRILFHPIMRPIVNRPVLSFVVRMSSAIQKMRLIDDHTLGRLALLHELSYLQG